MYDRNSFSVISEDTSTSILALGFVPRLSKLVKMQSLPFRDPETWPMGVFFADTGMDSVMEKESSNLYEALLEPLGAQPCDQLSYFALQSC